MNRDNLQIIRRLMLRLLPVQVMLSAVGAVNGIVTSFFATRFVGIDAMSAIGLYGPVSMLLGAISILLAGGSAIVCGRFLGQNQEERLQDIFSLNLLLSVCVSALFSAVLFLLSVFDLTGFFTGDENLRLIFNRYLLWQVIGILPMMIGQQFPTFLSMENRSRRTLTASLICIVMNLVFNLIFVRILKLEEIGLALAGSLGMWVFMAVELQYFLSGKSSLKIRFLKPHVSDAIAIVRDGYTSAASNIYQTFRGLIVNRLLETHIGSMGLSAFAAANSVMGIFWAVPGGMLAVSRLLISVGHGEEDRQTLSDIMRVMVRNYLPLMAIIDVLIILISGPVSGLFFQLPEVCAMMTAGLRILPLCMPFSIIAMHFNCYGTVSGMTLYDNVLAVMDGVAGVVGFSLILTPLMGIRGIYWANVLNGVITTLFIVSYPWIIRKKMPSRMDDLMCFRDDFGVGEEDRIDITVRNGDEVVTLARQIQQFCRERGIDEKRGYYSALATEEMVGNIVDHGFTKDNKDHTVDVRVAYKDDNVYLHIRDDCVPFDPEQRRQISENDDITKNIGIRMIYGLIKDIDYKNLLGLNVLTIKI